MTLDEAIKHAEEVAEGKEHYKDERKMHLDNKADFNNSIHYQEACKCAEEHRQLANWLKDYKQLLEQEPKTGRWICEHNCWMRCSECSKHYPHTSIYETKCFNYCPFCGAKMESEEQI